MQALTTHSAAAPCRGVRAGSTSRRQAAAARRPAAAAAAALRPSAAASHPQQQQHRSCASLHQQQQPAQHHQQQHHQRQQQRAAGLIARVRLNELSDDGAPGDEAATQIAGEALQAYMDLEQGGAITSAALDALRLKYGMRRDVAGRLQLRRASDGAWLQVKLDMEVAGIILLRSLADDNIWVLQTGRFQQVDLSDDYLAMMLFADPAWEEQLMPITLTDASGNASQLQMEEQEFKDYVGLIASLQAMSEEAAKEAGGAGGSISSNADGTIDVTAEVTSSRSS